MTEHKLLADTTPVSVIDDGTTLADDARAAGDYDNSTELDFGCHVYLIVQFDGGPPAVGADIAHLWVLPGDGAVTEVFPAGGDAGIGTDDDPQDVFYVGTFTAVNPSLTVDDTIGLPNVPLSAHTNRFVLKNVSGQTFDSTWELNIAPYKYQSV